MQAAAGGSFELSIDGVKQVSVNTVGPHAARVKLAAVRGLSFGDHTVRWVSTSAASLSIDVLEVMK